MSRQARPVPVTVPLFGGRCEGNPELFLSTDRRNHGHAAEQCAVCPVLVGCRENRDKLLAAGTFVQGTWAGLLYGKGGTLLKVAKA